jgi:hypothetical protein
MSRGIALASAFPLRDLCRNGVMAALVAAIHAFPHFAPKAWMAGPRPARERWDRSLPLLQESQLREKERVLLPRSLLCYLGA